MNSYLLLLSYIKLLILITGAAFLLVVFETEKRYLMFLYGFAFLVFKHQIFSRLKCKLNSSFKLERKILKELCAVKKILSYELYVFSDVNLKGINLDLLALSKKFLLLIEVKPKFYSKANKQLLFLNFKLKTNLKKSNLPPLPVIKFLATPSKSLKKELYLILKEKENCRNLVEKKVIEAFVKNLPFLA